MATQLSHEQHKAINWMDRSRIVSILEDYGFACYDRETDDDLRNALRENIADATISASVLND